MTTEVMLNFNSKATPSIFDEIRNAFRAVAEQADHVRIDFNRLAEMAQSIYQLPRSDVYDATHHYVNPANAEKTAAYVMLMDSINFAGSLKHDLEAEGLKLRDNSLYFTMATQLKQVFEQNDITATDILAMTPQSVHRMLGLGQGPLSERVSRLYHGSMQDLAGMVQFSYDGRFLKLVESAEGSADRLTRTLSRLAYYRDISTYRGMNVPFLKRAQITAADLHLAFDHLGQRLFRDIHNMTMFPDNAVAHALHVDGALVYAHALKEKIFNGVELPYGSEEEIEIRACSACAVDVLASYTGLMPMNVDHVLWHRSHGDAYRRMPCHRTLTPFY